MTGVSANSSPSRDGGTNCLPTDVGHGSPIVVGPEEQTDGQKGTKTKKLRGLSPRANYTDRAAATGRRSWCQLLRIEGCHVVSATGPHGRLICFLDLEPLLFDVELHLYVRGVVRLNL